MLTMDGVGEWATTSLALWHGQPARGSTRDPLPALARPALLGFTYYTGFKVNSGEYKVMGLAPYGEPRYVQADLRAPARSEGRTARSGLNLDYFDYCTGLTMTNERFDTLFGGAAAQA